MPDRFVSRAEIADRIGLSARQITNLVRSGKLSDGTVFPSRVNGRDRTFPVERCFEWYVRFKQEEALERAAGRPALSNIADAELRKAIADAEIAELKVQRLRGEVAPIEQYRNEMRRVMTRVASRFRAMPGEYASKILEPLDMPRATNVLRDMVGEVLAELQVAARSTSVEEIADGEDGDAPDAPDAATA